MAERIGIKVAPDVLEMLFRIGALISGSYGFAARLVQDGVPQGHELVDCGYNRQEGQFFFIFAPQAGPGARARGLAGAGLREGAGPWN